MKLVVVPVIYTYLYSLGKTFERWFGASVDDVADGGEGGGTGIVSGAPLAGTYSYPRQEE
jgi:hypothetical protein